MPQPMDPDFVKATMLSLQPHHDAVKAETDKGDKADPQKVLNHLSAINVNVGIAQSHAKAATPGVVTKAENMVGKAIGEVEKGIHDVFPPGAIKFAPAPAPAPAPASTFNWLRYVEYAAGLAGAIVVVAYLFKHYGG